MIDEENTCARLPGRNANRHHSRQDRIPTRLQDFTQRVGQPRRQTVEFVKPICVGERGSMLRYIVLNPVKIDGPTREQPGGIILFRSTDTTQHDRGARRDRGDQRS